MRRTTAAAVSVAWGVALGVTFAGLLPYLLGDWRFHRPLPDWVIAQVAGGLLIGAGLVPIVASFIEFAKANGAAAVRWYEEPTLTRKFGAEYRDYRRAVRAWIPRLHPWTPGQPAGAAGHDAAAGR